MALEIRPVFHKSDDRIRGHVNTLCRLVLLVFSVLNLKPTGGW